VRIGVDYRILTVGPELLSRGIGRYTQQQLRAVLQRDSENEYVLLCNSGTDLSLIDAAARRAPNVSVREFPAHLQDGKPIGDPSTMLRHAEEYQDWVYRQDIDLFHATVPFLFERPILLDFDVCPMVATFYDLIPLIFPTHYLKGWWRAQYLRTLAFLGKAERMIAISHAAKSDATRFLGYPSDRVDVAWPIPDDCFRPLAPEVVDRSLERLRSRIPLPDRYVLTVSHLHHTKNLYSLLRAYALLPPTLRASLPLVVGCHLDANSLTYLRTKAAQLGLTENVVTTGLTVDDDLAVLYNGATMVVHPSRYEGFGLPVIEALRCGTPVITTTASSLPEAGGDAALLVDPDDVHGFARAIETLANDEGLRQAMAERGLAHTARFDTKQLGRATLDSYTAAVARAGQPVPARPRIAVWTPLPPQQSGIADYSVELLAELHKDYDLEVFVDDDCLPPATLLTRHRIQHFTAFQRRHEQKPFDGFVYQMGGSLFHVYMYDALLENPGIAVLHDLTWSHVLYTVALDNDDFEPFRRQLTELEGEDARREFDRIQRTGPDVRPKLLEQFLADHRMLKAIVDRSRAQVVHVRAAASELERAHPNANVFTIPMGVADPQVRHRFETPQARAKLGLSPATLLLGTFGIVHRTKRLETCVTALAELCSTHPDTVLLLVGAALEEGYVEGLHDLARELGVLPNLRYVGRVSREDFDEYMLACDVVVNLRSATSTHMSATLIRAIAAGKPLVMTDLPEWGDIPDEVCLRVPPTGDETSVLVNHLRRLAAEPALRRRMARSAQLYFRAEATSATMAARYRDVLDKVLTSAPRPVVTNDAVTSEHDERPRSQASVSDFPFNKLCEIEDFSHPELAATIRDVCGHKLAELPAGFPEGAEHRKDWEVGMAVRTLRRFGALHPDSVVLGVAAGAEDTSFYLTRHVRQVFATDRYLASGEWEPTAPLSMLVQPQEVAPFDFDLNRLVVQHMDGRCLRYPDDTFDGIFSSGSIEHFGDLQDVANAAYEMGRVLKPGGVLSLSTEFSLGGPPGGIGWPGLTLLFSAENLRRFIIDASGLEPVDDLREEVSEATLATPRDLTLEIEEHLKRAAEGASGDHRDAYDAWGFPHVLLVHEGYVFTSVHLALRKTDDYPRVPNQWARPSGDVVDSIAEHNRGLVREKAEAMTPATPAVAAENMPPAAPGSWEEHRAVVDDCLAVMNMRLAEIDALLPELDRFSTDATLLDQRGAEAAGYAEMISARTVGIDEWMGQLATRDWVTQDDPSPDPPAWTRSSVTLSETTRFDVVVDPRAGDQVTATLAVGRTVDEHLLALMLRLIAPGERVLDLGAHVGTFSLAAAAAGAHALAVEASAENVALLRASVARNGFRNVRVIQAVASNEPGQIHFHPHGPWGQVVLEDEADGSVAVAALTVDELVQELGWLPLAFVKMDVEGWEMQVLDGMRQVLGSPQAPPVLYECNGHTLLPYGATPEDLVAKMEEFGYTSYLVEQDRLIRVSSSEFQPQTLVDYLALKRPPSMLLDGWPVESAMTLDDRVARIVADTVHPNFNHRRYMAGALGRAGAEILGTPAVKEAVDALAQDPNDEVREALASWSPTTLEGDSR
jgi:FkbM family methyltransferase